MRSAIVEQTKFKFGDRIIVKYGFYRGMSGKVHNYHTFFEGRFTKTKYAQYHIMTDVGNIELLVIEDQIELVGHK